MLRTASAAVLLALALITAACGDDDGTDPDAESAAKATSSVEDERTTGVFYDLGSVLDAVEESIATTGEVPGTAGPLGAATYSEPRPRIDYRPSSDRRGFKLCLQSGKRGPWVTYDTAHNGVVSVDTKGACSWDPPEPGSASSVRRDQWQILTTDAVEWNACDNIPSDDKLRGEGLLSEGNSIECRVDDYLDGDVEVLVFCVQHGDDGPWTTYDGVNEVVRGDGGPCRLDIGQEADKG